MMTGKIMFCALICQISSNWDRDTLLWKLCDFIASQYLWLVWVVCLCHMRTASQN